MTFWDDLSDKKKTFTSKELEVAQHLERDPFAFSSGTATEVAKKYSISQSSITRFCQKMGFEGYSDFRLSLILAIALSDEQINSGLIEYAQSLSDIIVKLANNLDEEKMDFIANKIVNARNTYTSGYGASLFPAYLLAFRCVLISVPVYHIVTNEEIEKIHIMNKDDVVILFSASNSSHKDFIDIYKGLPANKKPYLILISSSKNHPFNKDVDCELILPYLSNINNSYHVHSIVQIFFTLFLLQKIYSIKMGESKNK